MNSETKLSLLALANAAMREKNYTTAISLYKSAIKENASLSEQVNFNIALAENRLKRQSQPALSSVLKSEKESPAPAQAAVTVEKKSPVPAQAAAPDSKVYIAPVQAAATVEKESPVPAQAAARDLKVDPAPLQATVKVEKKTPTAQAAAPEVKVHPAPSQAEVTVENTPPPPPPPTNVQFSLIETSTTIKPGLRGHIDVVDQNFVHGWIYDQNTMDQCVQLDLYADNIKLATTKAELIRTDVQNAGGKAECGFKLEHGKHTNLVGFSELRIYISGTTDLAFSQIIEVNLLSAQVAGISKLAKIIKRELATHSDPSMLWLSSTLIPKLMEKTRKGEVEKSPSKSRNYNYLTQPKSDIVSVIIPVYEGYEETLNCINSVLSSKNEHTYNLTVINDCSPNDKLTQKLRRHSQHHKYELVENKNNLGFVGTVNRGMRLADKNDVILLNSDTLVPDRWLDQLVSAAYSDPIIGTVTPFSNNATICSYPNFCQDNTLPIGHDVNSLNSVFHGLNSGKVLDLPTAHGFCMFIKRAVINEVGVFDEHKWGKGYAEENDFSLRAEQHGWRNVLAVDTFVQHLGSVSFSSNTEEFVRKNLKILNGIYPDYAARVSQFIENDPVRKYRNTVSRDILVHKLNRLKTNSKTPGNFILFVSLTIGGGTQVATDELSKHLTKEGAPTLMLTSPAPDIWRLSHTKWDIYLDYNNSHENEELINDLKALGVWHINYHNTIEFSKHVWDLPHQLGCEYDVTVHDYLSICPRVNLIDNTRAYCGEPTAVDCNACINRNGAHESSVLQISDFNADINQWRNFYEVRFSSARKIFVPSNDVGKRLNKYFKDLEITVRPHPEPVKTVLIKGASKAETINVAFLGAIGIHKGYDYLLGCANYATEKNLPIKFHVIGYTKDDEEVSKLPNVVLHGQYTKPELPHLLKKSGCRIAAILSVWPETFSYTFSEALECGLKIITFNMGAPVERLPVGCGSFVELGDDYEEICSKIVELSSLPEVKITTGKTYKSYLSEYYEFDNIN